MSAESSPGNGQAPAIRALAALGEAMPADFSPRLVGPASDIASRGGEGGEIRALHEVARFFRVSGPTVRSWIEDGCPVVERGSNGRAYKLDLVAVHEWREGREKARADAEAEKRARDRQLELELLGGESLSEDTAGLSPAQRAAALRAEYESTRLAELRGELLRAEGVALVLTRLAGLVRDRITNIPDELGRVAGLDGDQVEHVRDLLGEILDDFALELQERKAELGGDA